MTIYRLVGSIESMKDTTVYHKILDVAEELIQKQGFHAFSYKDISARVAIKTSSIHYHFPTKDELGKKVIERHMSCIKEALENLSKEARSPREKINIILDLIYGTTFESERRMCLGGMLAIDALLLNEAILSEVRRFFLMLEGHLADLLQESASNNEFVKGLDSKELARIVMSTIEGSLVLARLYNNKNRTSEIKVFINKLID